MYDRISVAITNCPGTSTYPAFRVNLVRYVKAVYRSGGDNLCRGTVGTTTYVASIKIGLNLQLRLSVLVISYVLNAETIPIVSDLDALSS